MRGRGRGQYYEELYGNKNRSANQPRMEASEVSMNGKRGSFSELSGLLCSLEKQSYPGYKSLKGSWQHHDFTLCIDRVQGDTYAPPTNIRVLVDLEKAKFPADLYCTRIRTVAMCDYLCRRFLNNISQNCRSGKDLDNPSWKSEKGGDFHVDIPGQQVIERTAIAIENGNIVATFSVNLPAMGRSIMGNLASKILTVNLPDITSRSLFASAYNLDDLRSFVQCIDDQEELREVVVASGGVAFIREGAILARVSGNSDKPMPSDKCVPHKSPESLKRTFTLKSGRAITGTFIPRGVTLISGGGFHGKSTLLKALSLGIYNHIPNDGREFVCVDPTATTIRAEDGRYIESVDISPFIGDLPSKKDTKKFRSEDASGSVSMAASIIEAAEMSSRVILIDEDTAATNFLYRDLRMQKLISPEMEPIKVFLKKVRSLLDDCNCSTIFVFGSCGDYIDVSDTIVCMQDYVLKDMTKEAKALAEKMPLDQKDLIFGKIPKMDDRVLDMKASNPSNQSSVYPKTRSLHTISFDKIILDISGSSPQIVDMSQTRFIAACMFEIMNKWNKSNHASVRKILKTFDESRDKSITKYIESASNPMDNISNKGLLARIRSQDLGIALNRLVS